MVCWWCFWDWPKPMVDIYRAALLKLKNIGLDALSLTGGPGHIVWDDENWDMAQKCLDDFEVYASDMFEEELAIVRESLENLVLVSEEYMHEPDGYDGQHPENYPPPKHWECVSIREIGRY